MYLDNIISIDLFAIIFDIITILILLYVTFKNITKIMSEVRVLVYMVFFVFYVLPLILDYLIGFPDYQNDMVQGFKIAQVDTATRIIYDVFLLLCTWMILKFRPRKEQSKQVITKKTSDAIYLMVVIGMFLPTLAALLFQMPSYMLVVPMWRELQFVEMHIFELPKNYAMVEQIDFVGICCCIICLFGKLRNSSIVTRLLAIAFLYVNICIEGKRGIIFFALMCVILMYCIHMQMQPRSKKYDKKNFIRFALYGVIAVAIMVVVSVNVKAGRGYAEDPLVMYTTLRVDFLRDDRVRFAIFESIHPDRLKILDYPCQTVWPFFSYVFPIDVFLSKFFNFSQPTYSFYLSSALKGGGLSADESFMTPALFGELVSNFSLLGVFVMALFSIWFIKKIDKYPYPINVFLIISFTAWQMYSVGYIMLYLEFTFALCVIYNYMKNNSKKRVNAEI